MNFRDDALREMADITAQGKIPLLVGGTMLYYKALIEGLSPLPSADEKLRLEIEEKAQKLGWPALHQDYKKIDPVSAERINPNDSQRINRALEVFYLTGKSLTELTEQKRRRIALSIFTICYCTRRSRGVTSTYRTTFP